MKHKFLGLLLIAAVALTGCGGGGGGGGGGGSAGSSYSFQTEIFSPVSSQASGTLASLVNPRFMAFSGNYLYVAGGTDQQVVRIGTDGVQTTLTGFSGGPVGVVVSSTTLYVTQTGGLYSLNVGGLTNGMVNNVSPTLINSNCSNCLGLALYGDILYAARNGASNSVFTYNIPNSTPGSINLSTSTNVTGLTFNSDGSVLFATDFAQSSANSNGLNVFSVSATLSRTNSLPIGNQPYSVVVASNGDLYVSNWSSHVVTRVHGNVLSTFLDSTQLCHPSGLAIKDGYLYVANEPNCAGQNQTRGYIRRATIDLS